MPVRRTSVLNPSKLPLYLQPRELAHVQRVLHGALRVAFASTFAAAGCSDAHGESSGALQAGSGAAVLTNVRGAAGSGDAHGGGDAGGAVTAAAGTIAPAANGGNGAAADASVSQDLDCDRAHWQPLAGIKPAEPFDFAALRRDYQAGISNEIDHSGSVCSGASDMTKCLNDVAAVKTNLVYENSYAKCGQPGPCADYIVTTHGDVVKHYVSRAEFLEFLGPIDAPKDALLLLYYDNYDATCAEPSVVPNGTGFDATVSLMVDDCPVQYAHVAVSVSADGQVTEHGRELQPGTGPCIGRRPEGLVAPASCPALAPLAEHFARTAELEAASVAAFEIVARELEQLDAPPQLIAAARAAADDEVRHARVMAVLARRFGATPTQPRIERRPLRDLESLALDNAVEGCVRETFGAAVGGYQALTASDPEIAAAMREVAADEARHAALAHELDAWLMPQLTFEARARVERARGQAIEALADETQRLPSSSLREVAGVPDVSQAAALLAVLSRELWS